MSNHSTLSCMCALYMISIQVLQSNSRTSTHWKLDVEGGRVVDAIDSKHPSQRGAKTPRVSTVTQTEYDEGNFDSGDVAFDILSTTMYHKSGGGTTWTRAVSVYEDVCEECKEAAVLMPDSGVVFDVL